MRWHTRITSSTSCSTSRMPRPSAARSSRSVANVVGLVLAQPGGRLVEQQQRRLVRPAPDRPPPAAPGRSAARRPARRPPLAARPGRGSPRPGHRDRCSASAPARRRVGPVHLGGDPDVVARRHRAEQLQPLEGAGDAHPGPLGGLHLGDVGAVEQDPASVDPLQPAHGVEQRGLAGSVRTDQARRRRRRRRRGRRRRARCTPPKRTVSPSTSNRATSNRPCARL